MHSCIMHVYATKATKYKARALKSMRLSKLLTSAPSLSLTACLSRSAFLDRKHLEDVLMLKQWPPYMDYKMKCIYFKSLLTTGNTVHHRELQYSCFLSQI